jgi:hypothetical protein
MASHARVLGFVDYSAYFTRTVGDILVERTHGGQYFNVDNVGNRGKWRVDGDLADLNAGASLVQNV